MVRALFRWGPTALLPQWIFRGRSTTSIFRIGSSTCLNSCNFFEKFQQRTLPARAHKTICLLWLFGLTQNLIEKLLHIQNENPLKKVFVVSHSLLSLSPLPKSLSFIFNSNSKSLLLRCRVLLVHLHIWWIIPMTIFYLNARSIKMNNANLTKKHCRGTKDTGIVFITWVISF